jgi:hypothetical protein
VTRVLYYQIARVTLQSLTTNTEADMKMTAQQLNDYRRFCSIRGWRQTSKGLRYAYSKLIETGDQRWMLICSDCADSTHAREDAIREIRAS